MFKPKKILFTITNPSDGGPKYTSMRQAARLIERGWAFHSGYRQITLRNTEQLAVVRAVDRQVREEAELLRSHPGGVISWNFAEPKSKSLHPPFGQGKALRFTGPALPRHGARRSIPIEVVAPRPAPVRAPVAG